MHRLACLALLLLATPAAAQTPPATVPGAPDPARVVAGSYAMDSAHSQVVFEVTHLGFSQYQGEFDGPTGTLTIDPAHPDAARVEVTIPIAQVRTTVAALDAHLKRPDFFDADRFPQGRFVSTRVAVSGRTATIAGDLTLKGVTRPVVLAARFIGAGPSPQGGKLNVGFAATTTIRRSDFGLGYGVPMVSDAVKLTINAAFEAR